MLCVIQEATPFIEKLSPSFISRGLPLSPRLIELSSDETFSSKEKPRMVLSGVSLNVENPTIDDSLDITERTCFPHLFLLSNY